MSVYPPATDCTGGVLNLSSVSDMPFPQVRPVRSELIPRSSFPPDAHQGLIQRGHTRYRDILHFPVQCRFHGHVSVDYPGIYVMNIVPFWNPAVSSVVTNHLFFRGTLAALTCATARSPSQEFLCENAISGISASLGYVLKKLECVVSSLCHFVTPHSS